MGLCYQLWFSQQRRRFLSFNIISNHLELGIRMDRACPMLENITRSNLTRRHQSNKTILAIIEKSTIRDQSCQRKATTGRPRTVATNENHERLLQQVLQSPKPSLRQTSLKLGVSDRSVRRMLKRAGRIRISYSSCSTSRVEKL